MKVKGSVKQQASVKIWWTHFLWQEMFDDEEEDEEVGMEEGESSQVDTEADIDVTDIGGEEPSLKRKSPPPTELPPPLVLSIGSVPETCPLGIFNEDSASQSKRLKLKVFKTVAFIDRDVMYCS